MTDITKCSTCGRAPSERGAMVPDSLEPMSSGGMSFDRCDDTFHDLADRAPEMRDDIEMLKRQRDTLIGESGAAMACSYCRKPMTLIRLERLADGSFDGYWQCPGWEQHAGGSKEVRHGIAKGDSFLLKAVNVALRPDVIWQTGNTV